MELTRQQNNIIIFVNLKLRICISFRATLVLINVPKSESNINSVLFVSSTAADFVSAIL